MLLGQWSGGGSAEYIFKFDFLDSSTGDRLLSGAPEEMFVGESDFENPTGPWEPVNFGPNSKGMWLNEGTSRKVTVKIWSERSLVGEGIDWRVSFGTIGGNSDAAPSCPNGGIPDSETYGPNASRIDNCGEPTEADPISTRTGNLHMPLPGIEVQGRGPGLNFGLAYNSLAVSTGGLTGGGSTGHGWASVADMRLEEDGSDLVVVQENGTTVTFEPDGADWAAPARLRAELVDNNDGTFTFTRRHFTSFVFDESTGRLEEVADQFGNTTTFAYDGSGQLDYMEDVAGRRLTFGWSSGRIASVTDDEAHTVGLSYDGSGDLTTFTDVGDGDWVMTYDGSHRLETLRKPRHSNAAKVIEMAYDHLGRGLWQEDELNRRTSFAFFEPDPGKTTVTYPSGRQRIYEFTDGACSAIVDAPGAANERRIEFERDPDTLVLESSTDGGGNQTVFTNDARGNRLSATDPTGRVTRWTYSGFDQVTSEAVGETAAPLTASTAAVVTSEIAYNGDGLITEVTAASGSSAEATTSYDYDPSHPDDLVAMTDGRSKIWNYVYDPDTGDLLETADPLGNTITNSYNEIGWLESTVAPEGNESGAIPADWTSSFEHDEWGRVIEETDPLSNRTKTTYDPNGNVTAVEAGLSATVTTGDTTTFGFDDADQLTSVDPPGAGSRAFSYDPDGRRIGFLNESSAPWEYSYDNLGRLESQEDPAGGVTAYTYEEASRLATLSQPGGDCDASPKVDCITYSYDAAGRPTAVDYSDAATPDVTSLVYDPLGRRIEATVGSETEEWDWDAQSRLIGHADVNGRSTAYGWDDTNNLTSITYPGKSTPLTRAFDDAGRLESVTDWSSRTTAFDYDANSNWTETTFPSASTNIDLRTYDRADQLTSVAWKRGATTLGSLTYGNRDTRGRVTTVTAAGAGQENNTWAYDNRDRLTGTDTETFDYDATTNLIDADGTMQVFDPAQRLCWTSPTTTTGSCTTPASDATTYDYDVRGNRTSKTLPSGTTTTYGFDGANRLTSANVPTVYDPETRQFQLLTGGAARVADGSDGTGSCNGSACAPFTASTTYDVDIAGQGGVPATGVTAVTGSITVTDPDGDGWLTVNAAGDAAAATIPLQDGETATATFTAALDSSGEIQLETDVDATVAVDITGYWTPPPAWVPALNYWPVTPAIAARSNPVSGTCNGSTCGTLSAGTTEVSVAGVGGIPATGVSAVTVGVVASNTSGGQLRMAPHGDASAGDISWDSSFPIASGSFTVPVKSNGRIDVEVASSTDIILSVTGYWKLPNNNDTGLGLNVLDAPERLVDTRDGTGTCDGTPCDQIPANTDITIDVAGKADIPEGADAVMVSVNVVDPAAAGLASIGANPSEGGAPIVYAAGEDAQASFITGLAEDGTINVTSWAATDLTIDVIGYFELPTFNYAYSYDATGLRTAKTYEGGPSEGGWRNEYTWDRSGGLPLLLAEHSAAGTSYLIYGPGNTPIYQVTTSGDVMYYHQDHLGSTRLTTNANGTSRGVLTYDAYGETKSNTNPWFLEQPLLTFAGEQRDAETGFVYLRARYYDPATGQFLSQDPLVALTGEPYGYTGGNPANATDPTGLCPWCIPLAIVAVEGALSAWDAWDAYQAFTDGCASTRDKLIAGGFLAAGILMPGNLGWIDNAAHTGQRVTLLGRVDDLAEFAGKPGLDILNLPSKGPGRWFWRRNRAFIDQAIARGDAIWFVTDPTSPIYRGGNILQREIRYLKDLGFQFERFGDFWVAFR